MSDGLYFTGLAVALLAYVTVFCVFARKAGAPGRFMALSIIFSVLLAFCLSRGNVYLFGGFMTRQRGFLSLTPYDYSVMGSLLGAVLGTILAAEVTGTGKWKALDLISPAMLAGLAVARLAEWASDFGWGALVFEPGAQFFPLCVMDSYGQYHLAVFLFESLAALAILLAIPRHSEGTGLCFILSACRFMLSQVFFESLRAETLRIGFVRVQQVECMVFILVLILLVLHSSPRTLVQCILVHLAVVGVAAFSEFALDKLSGIPAPVVYLIMCGALTADGVFLNRKMAEALRH